MEPQKLNKQLKALTIVSSKSFVFSRSESKDDPEAKDESAPAIATKSFYSVQSKPKSTFSPLVMREKFPPNPTVRKSAIRKGTIVKKKVSGKSPVSRHLQHAIRKPQKIKTLPPKEPRNKPPKKSSERKKSGKTGYEF